MINFDNSPILYLVLCHGIGWIVLVLAIWPPELIHNQTWVTIIKNDNFFLAIFFLTLFLMRLPSIVYDSEINMDESQMVSQALTLRYDPIYFRSVDGTTGGPLNSYLLVLPHFIGLPFDYITVRLVAFALLVVSFGLTFSIARDLFGQQAARLSLIPFLLLLGSSKTYDFFIYGSELLSVATLSWLYYLVRSEYKQPNISIGQLLLIGFLCGLVPFEKIQGLLLAGVAGLFVVYQILNNKSLVSGQKWQQLLILGAGALCFPVAFIAWMYSESLFEDFVNFYIQDNLSYSQPLTFFQKLIGFRFFAINSIDFTWFLILLTSVFVLLLLTDARQYIVQAKFPTIYLFLLAILLTAFYTVTFPGTYFIHYLYYLFGPLMMMLAFLFSNMRSPFSRISTTLLVVAFVGAFGLRIAYEYRQHIVLNPFTSEKQGGWKLPQTVVTEAIARYGHKGETLAVWGWHTDYYVRLQMPQAVAENHTIRSIEHKTMKPIYHRRYASHMLRSLPPVFVDVVGKQHGFYLNNRKTMGFEINAALRQIVAAHYTYIGETDGVRVYVRKDRFKKVNRSSPLASFPQ